MKFKILDESTWDDVYGHDYWNTDEIKGEDIIDINKPSYGNYDLFDTPEKRQQQIEKNNLFGRIVMMSPEEYFQACAKAFGNTTDNLKAQRAYDKEKIEALKEVILEKHKKFPMPYLDVTLNDYGKGNYQEGLHRMMVIGELFGWDKKVPVFLLTYYSVKRNNSDKKNYDKKEAIKELRSAVNSALRYDYDVESCLEYESTIEDNLLSEVDMTLNRHLDEDDEFYIKIDIRDAKDNLIIFEVGNPNIKVYIPKEDIKITYNEERITFEQYKDIMFDNLVDNEVYTYLFDEGLYTDEIIAITEDWKKKKKKKKNKDSLQGFFPDVEKNVEFFNHAVGADGSNQPSGESVPMGENFNLQEMLESGTSQLYRSITNTSNWAIISPYRTEYSYADNKKRMIELKSIVRNQLRLGFIELKSSWVEDGEQSDEYSLFIKNISYKDAFNLSQKYEQSSFIFCQDDKCQEICTTSFESFNVGDVVRTFNIKGDHVLNIADAQAILDKKASGPASQPIKGNRPFQFQVEELEQPRASYFQTEKSHKRIY